MFQKTLLDLLVFPLHSQEYFFYKKSRSAENADVTLSAFLSSSWVQKNKTTFGDIKKVPKNVSMQKIEKSKVLMCLVTTKVIITMGAKGGNVV